MSLVIALFFQVVNSPICKGSRELWGGQREGSHALFITNSLSWPYPPTLPPIFATMKLLSLPHTSQGISRETLGPAHGSSGIFLHSLQVVMKLQMQSNSWDLEQDLTSNMTWFTSSFSEGKATISS